MGYYKNLLTSGGKVDVDIQLIGDEEIYSVLSGLDYRVQQIELKKILRDTANQTIVKALKQHSPVRTGGLQKSMGVITGKSKRSAVVFAGPRMSHHPDKAKTGGYSGWVANILENAKPDKRYPTKAKALFPFDYPNWYRSVGPIRRKTNFTSVMRSSLVDAQNHFTKSVRKILEREVKKYNKNIKT